MAGETRETEKRDPKFDDFDNWPTETMLGALLAGQAAAIEAVAQVQGQIAAAVDAAADRLRDGSGRLCYAGAGTSGRLAVLDGVELAPTFGWPHDRLVTFMAGGDAAFRTSVEDAEDDRAGGMAEVEAAGLDASDVLIGVAASGSTPYTRGVVEASRARRALTVTFANNPDAPLLADAEFGILLRTGAEVLAGSTRLAAGTSQKVALNAFSTALMARLHRTYKGYMVDVLPTNEKLRARSVGMVSAITDVDADAARAALEAVEFRVKPAVLVALGKSAGEAEAALQVSGGDLRAAMG